MGKTIVLSIEYDGTNYSGWQRQKNSNSIQQTIENAIKKATNFDLHVIAAGRTDAGVHALNQIAHCRIPDDFPIPEEKIATVINSKLPLDIYIKSAKIIESNFHATKDAIGRAYIYRIHTTPNVFIRKYSLFVPFKINLEILNDVAKVFLGEHDFTAFSKRNPSTRNYVCNVSVSQWEMSDNSQYYFRVEANRFVYGMVRALVGVMLDYCRRRRSIEEIKKALNTGKKFFPYPLAKACGLFLEKIIYPPEKNFF